MRLRELRPTASQCSRVITGTGKDSSSWPGYLHELTNNKQQTRGIREAGIWTGNRHTDRGHENEPLARECFKRLMKMEVAEVGFITRDDLIWGCSPDGLVWHRGEKVAGIEIKCPQGPKHIEHLEMEDVPSEYVQQIHCSMVVTGFNFWYFMSYAPCWKPRIIRVERNAYTAKVESAMNRFQDYFVAGRARLIDTHGDATEGVNVDE